MEGQESLERLQKRIAQAGVASRRKAEELISAGRVFVNGRVAELGQKVGAEDEVVVDGKILRQEEKTYIMLNKPRGYVCSRSGEGKHPSVYQLVRVPERVFTVGRLDAETTGLLLLTNDGDFAQKITHPSGEIQKVYEVEIRKPISEEDLRKIEAGMKLKDDHGLEYETQDVVARVTKNRRHIRISLHQGKYHVVRKIFAKLGHEVVSLHRTQIGGLELGSLPEGKIRTLTPQEQALVFQVS